MSTQKKLFEGGEDERLKEFMLAHFDFATLKQVGFYQKEIKAKDYKAQAARVCLFFGFESIYEYGQFDSRTTSESPTVINGKFPDKVNEKGAIVSGGTFHLDIIETFFECPICTCKQDASEHAKFNNAKYPSVVIKCKGCKRKLQLFNDQGGNLTVTEVKK